jgi:hypothetical protein
MATFTNVVTLLNIEVITDTFNTVGISTKRITASVSPPSELLRLYFKMTLSPSIVLHLIAPTVLPSASLT